MSEDEWTKEFLKAMLAGTVMHKITCTVKKDIKFHTLCGLKNWGHGTIANADVTCKSCKRKLKSMQKERDNGKIK